jgi:hypothetical protein
MKSGKDNLTLYPLKLFILLTVAAFVVVGLIPLNQPAVAQGDDILFLPLVKREAFTRPHESIMILSPGPGSRVTSPVYISGISDPTFEQNLVIRVLLADGTEVAMEPTTIQAELGERGPFDLDLVLDLDEEEPIFIQVFDTSARDGGIIHLSSVVVIFSPTGPEDILVREPYPEQIAIFQPNVGDTIFGGTMQVEGFALASFEQTLLVEVLDENGNVIASEPVMVEAPDLGIPGAFQVEIEYTVGQSGPGRVVVRDVSPAHGEDSHLNSVEVILEP